MSHTADKETAIGIAGRRQHEDLASIGLVAKTRKKSGEQTEVVIMECTENDTTERLEDWMEMGDELPEPPRPNVDLARTLWKQFIQIVILIPSPQAPDSIIKVTFARLGKWSLEVLWKQLLHTRYSYAKDWDAFMKPKHVHVNERLTGDRPTRMYMYRAYTPLSV